LEEDFFKETPPPNVRIFLLLKSFQTTNQNIEIAQLNRTIRQMQNETTHLKRADNVVQPYQYERHVQQNFINRGYTNQRNEEHEPRTPRLQNPNVVMLEEIKE
jgi:hypothetical protein